MMNAILSAMSTITTEANPFDLAVRFTGEEYIMAVGTAKDYGVLEELPSVCGTSPDEIWVCADGRRFEHVFTVYEVGAYFPVFVDVYRDEKGVMYWKW
jgi:hypothetical protein